MRYLDPDGMFTYDSHDPTIIHANLDDIDDLRAAGDAIAEADRGLKIHAYGKNSGISKVFENYAQLNSFINRGCRNSLKSEIIYHLNNVHYDGENTFSNSMIKGVGPLRGQISHYDFKIGSNLLLNLGTSLPDMSSATMEDIACSVNNMGPVASGIIASLQTGSKMTRGLGNVQLFYTTLNGKVSSWYIAVKTSDSTNILWQKMTEIEAKEYLKNLNEGWYDEKIDFKILYNRLD